MITRDQVISLNDALAAPLRSFISKSAKFIQTHSLVPSSSSYYENFFLGFKTKTYLLIMPAWFWVVENLPRFSISFSASHPLLSVADCSHVASELLIAPCCTPDKEPTAEWEITPRSHHGWRLMKTSTVKNSVQPAGNSTGQLDSFPQQSFLLIYP